MSSIHQIWPKPFCEAQWTGEADKADRGRDERTTSGNGQAWSLPSPRGQWRTVENGENWLQNHLWCPNDPRDLGIDDGDENPSLLLAASSQHSFVLWNILIILGLIRFCLDTCAAALHVRKKRRKKRSNSAHRLARFCVVFASKAFQAFILPFFSLHFDFFPLVVVVGLSPFSSVFNYKWCMRRQSS